MPRDSSGSRSRSRSPRNKRYHRRSSSDSERSTRRKHTKYDKKQKVTKIVYDFTARSDIKNHIRYDNVKIRHKSDEQQIMEEVKKILKKQFGPVQHVSKISGDDSSFCFAVGFKYDKHALQFIKEGGSIDSTVDRIKMFAKPTLIFQQCLPMIKEAKKNQKKEKEKEKEKSPEPKKQKYKKRSSSSRSEHKKKRYSSREKSNDRRDKKQYKPADEKSVWMFGLPWSIKGKQVQSYLADHTSGPFIINRWRWVRVKNSNCQFMQITLDEKKANKLLSLRQQQQIQGCPCIITHASSGQTQEVIKETLKQYQFKINFPEKINPAALYKALNDSARVVQIVSYQRMSDGRSDCFIVTLGSLSKAKDVKRLGFLAHTGIKLEETKGQLVFRPTKHSRLTESQL